MIGSISLPVPVNAIISEPPENINSKYFGYTPGVGYEETDTIKSGKGYGRYWNLKFAKYHSLNIELIY